MKIENTKPTVTHKSSKQNRTNPNDPLANLSFSKEQVNPELEIIQAYYTSRRRHLNLNLLLRAYFTDLESPKTNL